MTVRSWMRNKVQECLQCVICGKPAFYMSGKNRKGFCKDHKADAEKAQRNSHLARCARVEAAKDSHGSWEAAADRKMRRLTTKKEWK